MNIVRDRLLLAATSAVALSAAAAVSAHADTATSQTANASAASSTTVTEVLVTARKRTERLVDVPVAAIVADPKAVARYATSDLSTLSTQMPSVDIEREGAASGAGLAIRGISGSGGDTGIEQAVVVNIDGVPTSRGLIIYSDLFDVQSVQVLEGPQALFFGKNSPAGVVSITSVQPGRTFTGYAQLGYHFTDMAPEFFGAVTLPLTDDLSVRLATHISKEFGGFEKNVGRDIASPFDPGYMITRGPSAQPGAGEYDFRGTVAYRPAGPFDATFTLLTTKSTDNGSAADRPGGIYSCPAGQKFLTTYGVPDPFMPCSAAGQAINDASNLPSNVGANYPYSNNGHPFEIATNTLGSLRVNYRVDHITLTSITGYYNSWHSYWDGFDSTIWAQLDGALRESNNSFTQEVHAVSDFSGPLNFTLGGFYEYDDRTYRNDTLLIPLGPNTLTYSQALAAGFPENDKNILGRWDTWVGLDHEVQNAESVFGEIDWKILPNLGLSGGARYTREYKHIHNIATYVAPKAYYYFFNPSQGAIDGHIVDENISPQVTLTWHINRNTILYGAYKTGYLSGGFSTPTITPADATFENQQFKPETAEGGEIGAKTEAFGGRMFAALTAYYYNFDNMQLESYNPTLNAFFIENAGIARTTGVELNGHWQVTDDLNLRGYLAYNRAYFVKYENGQCYTGQTSAMGCIGGKTQNLSGVDIAGNSPWKFDVGFDYNHDISDGLRFGASADVYYRSSFLLDQVIPSIKQPGFALVNAVLSLSQPHTGWEVDLIARNLFDQKYWLGVQDKPGGSNVAPGELVGGLGLPREVILQVKKSF